MLFHFLDRSRFVHPIRVADKFVHLLFRQAELLGKGAFLPEKEVDELIRNSDGVYETASIEEVEEHDIFRENEM